MAEHIITLADHESRRLAKTGALLVVRPVVPQPTYGLQWAETPEGFAAYVDAGLNIDEGRHRISPLGRVGDVLVCKERWGDIRDSDCLGHRPFADRRQNILYAPDCPRGGYEDCLREEAGIKWHPASTMPRWAVRHRPIVIEAGVMRVKDLGGRQAMGAGMQVPAHMPQDGADYDWAYREFAAYWTRRFRKYPWESNPWVWTARVEREDDHA